MPAPSAPGRRDGPLPAPGPLTVVLAGGGTGGHTAAGLALARALRARLGDGVRLAWIGSETGIEATWVPAAGIAYHAIPTGKLRRQLAWRNVTDLTLRVPAGFGRALALLGRLRPRRGRGDRRLRRGPDRRGGGRCGAARCWSTSRSWCRGSRTG